MSIDESTAKGLTKRFQREVAEGIRRYTNKMQTLPLNARPKSQRKLVESVLKVAGPAAAFAIEVKHGVMWGVWRHYEIPQAGQGYMLTRFYWPTGDAVTLLPSNYPCFVTHHAVQRIAQSYLDSADQISELGEFIDDALYPVHCLDAAERQHRIEGLAMTEKFGDCWVVGKDGCALVGHNEHGARIVKTFLAVGDWDEWRHRKWDRYLDSDANTLIADGKTGDLLNLLSRGDRSDGARVGREVARFNTEARGLATKTLHH